MCMAADDEDENENSAEGTDNHNSNSFSLDNHSGSYEFDSLRREFTSMGITVNRVHGRSRHDCAKCETCM